VRENEIIEQFECPLFVLSVIARWMAGSFYSGLTFDGRDGFQCIFNIIQTIFEVVNLLC
jgi:hypothetical protein